MKMFNYADLEMILNSNISKKSNKVLYVFPNNALKKEMLKHKDVFSDKDIFLTTREIWNNNALVGRRFKDYVIIV